jgi:exopolysaccharide biosynthesis protein
MNILLSIVTLIVVISFTDITRALAIPEGFQPVIKENGVQVYKKYYPNGKKDYVTVVNILNATINNLTGEVVKSDDGKISKKVITEFWRDAVSRNTSTKKARVVINGAFFSTNDNPTGIAFGLKVDGRTITYGYAIGKEYLGQIRAFSLNAKAGAITPYSKDIFNSSTDVVGALDVTADKSALRYLPRTFVGVHKKAKNIVIFYSSNYARQIDAATTLKSFGASVLAMLDGGGSTSIVIDGKPLIATSRPIPHAIAVYSGEIQIPDFLKKSGI